MSTATPSSKQVALTPVRFLAETRAKTSHITDNLPYQDGGITTSQLPQAGLLYSLLFNMQGSIVVGGTVSSGTFNGFPYPAPFSILKRFKLYSNTNFLLRDLTGWGLYKWIRYRTGIDPQTSQAVPFSSNSLAYLGINQSSNIVPGANVAAQTYKFNLSLDIPVAYNRQAEAGLLVLQQNATFYTVECDWGNVSGGISATGGSNDLFNTLVGTSLTVTPTITYSLGMKWFETVQGISQLTSLFMSVSESIAQPQVTTGVNIIKVPVSDFYTMLLFEIINNGTPVAVANIQNPLLQHSGNVIDFTDNYGLKLVDDFYLHRGCPPMDGVIAYDLGIRQGMIDHRDALDAFNNRYVTDLQLQVTIPSTLSITGKNQVTAVYETLRNLNQG